MNLKKILKKRQKKLNIDTYDIEEEEIKDFWSNFRSSSFIREDDKIYQNNKIYEITSSLPYVLPCQIANGMNGELVNAIQLHRLVRKEKSCQSSITFDQF